MTFPILSNIQDDNVRLASAYRKYIKLASYLIFPLMVGLAAVAQPLVLLLLTEKWMMAAVLLQILCFDWMFDHLSIINLNLLYVKGRSDWALRMEIIKKTIATLIPFASIPFGIEGMCWGRVLYSLIAAYLSVSFACTVHGRRSFYFYWLYHTSGIAIIGRDFNRQQLLSVHFLLAAF